MEYKYEYVDAREQIIISEKRTKNGIVREYKEGDKIVKKRIIKGTKYNPELTKDFLKDAKECVEFFFRE